MFLESPEGVRTFDFGAQNSYFWRAQKVSWHLFLVPRTHIFGEPKRFLDICSWCPKLMFLESPEGFLTFVFVARNSCFWRVQKVAWHLFLVPKTHVLGEPRRFPDICFWCSNFLFLKSPEDFLTFVVSAQNLYFWRAQKVSWHLFLVPNSHVFGEPRRLPDICCWCPNLMFLESPQDFLTFVFGAQNSCFWRAQTVSWHLFLVPEIHVFGEPRGFLTFVIGAQNSCFWRAQKVSWHLFLVPKFLVFGEPRRCPDICFWCPTLIFLESPEGFLTFVFGAQNSWFWRAQKVPWQFMILQSPEGFLTFVFGAQNSCFLESPKGFLIFCFWFPQNSRFWTAQKVSWHFVLVSKTHVFGEPRRFPAICFWCPKLMFLESPEGLLTFVVGAQNSWFWRAQKVPWQVMILQSPEGFLTFVFGTRNSCFWKAQKDSWHFFGTQNSWFWRAQKVSWHLFLVPKTHIFGEPRRFPDICFWCPKLIFLESPEGFLTFVFGAQNSCFWRAQKISWHLFWVPKTHVFGEPRRFPDICFWCPKLMFLERPEGFLFFLVPKTHVLGESRRFPDICFWCPNFLFLKSPEDFLTFVVGAQNTYFWRAQKMSWLLFLVSKTHIFGAPRRLPDICCWCPNLIFLESPEGFLTFVFGAQNSCFWIVQKVSWHLLLEPKTHVFG